MFSILTHTHLGARVDQNLVDISARTGYSLIKAKPKTNQERAAEYYQVRSMLQPRMSGN